VTVSGPVSIVGNYEAIYLVTMSANFGTARFIMIPAWWDTAHVNFFPEGDVITITADPPVAMAGERYVWIGWEGVGDGSYTGTDNMALITVNGPITQTAHWSVEYYLMVVSEHDTPGGEGWYEAGSTAFATLETGTVEALGFLYVFSGWSGGASGIGLTSDPIVMDEPKTAIADWMKFIVLNPEPGVPTGSPVERAGSYVFTAPSDGWWTARIVNDAMRSIYLYVIDITAEPDVELLAERVNFVQLGLYPVGTAYSSAVYMLAGHEYMIVVTPYGGDGSLQIFDEFMPDMAASSQGVGFAGLGLSSGVLLISAICLCSYFVMRVGKLAGRELPVLKAGKRQVERKLRLPCEVLELK